MSVAVAGVAGAVVLVLNGGGQARVRLESSKAAQLAM